jgi:hypothetical protein
VVGTGFLGAGHVTPEALSRLRGADELLYLGADGATQTWLAGLNPSVRSLYDAYAPGRDRRDSYAEMVRRILDPVRAGREVCVALYGHPGVFVMPSHEAIRQARAEGFAAEMLPGISAEDCLFADLEVDPVADGCASYEATDFLLRPRAIDPTSALILWQVGGIGVTTYSRDALWSRAGLAVLQERLTAIYPPAHPAIVYEAPVFAFLEPVRHRTRLDALADAPVTVMSTLYVPPAGRAPADPALAARLERDA